MSTKTRIKIGTLRDDAMLFWGVVKMLAFILLAVLFVGFWTAFIATIALWMISIVQGFPITPATSGFLNVFTSQVGAIMAVLSIFTLMPLIIARGYLYIPREEVLDQIHLESLKPSPAWDFAEEGTPPGDDDGAQLVRVRALR